jgi:hypothetical protein
MAITVGTNQLSVVHKAASGTTFVFPDVCKVPGGTPPGVPIPYPNIAAAAIAQKRQAVMTLQKTSVMPALKAPVAPSEGTKVAMQVDGVLNSLHAKLRTLPAKDPNQWQAVLEEYIAAAAALYLLKRDDA